MKFRPLQDKILVLPEARIKSDVIQVMDNEADSRGTVVAVGDGQKYDNGNIFIHNSPKKIEAE